MFYDFHPAWEYETDERAKQIRDLWQSVRGPTCPPPAPPVSKKSESFKKEDFAAIDDHGRQLILATSADQHSISFDDLVSLLTRDLSTDVQKVRALYMWIRWQNLTDASSYPRDHPVSLPYGYLKYVVQKRKYLWEFFSYLCRLAGLPCVVLRGVQKESLSWKFPTRSPNSTWNAVHADGLWRLVHLEESFIAEGGGYVTGGWVMVEDAGKATRQQTGYGYRPPYYRQKFDDFFFLTDPEHFIYFFQPEEKAWQLLEKPWTFEKFARKPEVTKEYVDSGWRMSDKLAIATKAPKGKCAIRFDDVPRDESLNQYKLYFNPGVSKTSLPKQLQLESYVVVNASPKSLITRLPVPGLYQLHIFNKRKSVFIYIFIECSGPIKKQRPLPIIPEAGFGFGNEAHDAGLSEPSREDGMINVREGEKIRFKFRTQPSTHVRARLVHHDRESDEFTNRVAHEQKGDQVTVSVRVPYDDHNPEYGLQIDTWEGENDSDYNNVLNYLLTQDQQLTCTVKGRKEQIRDELELAITDDDAEVLENALLQFRASGDDDKSGQSHAKKKKNNSTATKELLLPACRRLNDLHRQAMETASEGNDVSALRTALMLAETSQLAYFLKRTTWYKQAEEHHKKLRRLSLVTKIEKLHPKHVSEIKSYTRPHAVVRDTIVATYILLGEAPDKLKKWRKVRALLGMRGSQAIMERIKNNHLEDINEESVQRAAALLLTFRWEEVRAVSIAAGAFYQWSKEVVEQFQNSQGTQADPTSKGAAPKKDNSA